MKIGNRSITKVLTAAFEGRHYKALLNMFINYKNPVENLKRYVLSSGEYPYVVTINTPTGNVTPTLFSSHDLLTVNEIFCREDYKVDLGDKIILDIGSNIGISGLYFLSRNNGNKCYLYEPNPNNIEKLKMNLSGFESRFELSTNGVSNENGEFEFGIEDSGRYGGIGVKTGSYISIKCDNINDVLDRIIQKEKKVNIVKIDIEGMEIPTINSIDESLMDFVEIIYFEVDKKELLKKIKPEILSHFNLSSYGWTRKLTNKQITK